ncbi:MAG: metal ABC transporter permease [Phycisphaerales bacterium]|nr:metal ABC transporter permease [Phycisphaerales bacterium]MCB9855409.1 metal ABC transporter permease [Phycisphaerales bacterium]
MRYVWAILSIVAVCAALYFVAGTFADDETRQVLALRQYNTRIVVVGTTLLGAAAGLIGTFMYLRKRAMIGDALSHATLPGIAIAFLIVGDKQIGALLIGAAVSGVVGVVAVIGLRNVPRIKEDAAIGIVLSVFFGLGLVFVRIAQHAHTGNQAGLDRFIYGTTAGMIKQDAQWIAITAAIVLASVVLMFKEFRLVCFDQHFAVAQGRSVHVIDLLMMAMVVLTTVVGLQAVGLILVVAMLIIPAASARFWTDDLPLMTILAGAFGSISGFSGAIVSARFVNLPAGAVIVLAAGVVFSTSMILAPRRGIAGAIVRRARLARRIGYQNVLRALCEREEDSGEGVRASKAELLRMRSWSARRLNSLLRRAIRRGDAAMGPDGLIGLSRQGRIEARRVLRNHRLWEIYLIRHADVAPSHVDRDADLVEHILPPELIRELELALTETPEIPPSPHGREAFS